MSVVPAPLQVQNEKLTQGKARLPGTRLFFEGTLFLGFLLLFAAFQNAGYLDVTDAEERFRLLRSIVDRGSVMINVWWQPELHPTMYSAGSVLATVPFYLLGKALLPLTGDDTTENIALVRSVLFAMQAFGALWMVLVARLIRRLGLDQSAAFWLTIVIGAGTLIFPYTKTFQTENLFGLCVTAVVYSLIRHKQTERLRYVAIGGLVLGYAATIKTEILLVAPILGAMVAWASIQRPGQRLRTATVNLLIFGACTIPGILGILAYNFARYGSFIKTGYPSGAFHTPVLSGLFIQFLSPGKGIVWYCPILLLAFYLVPRFFRRQPFEATVLLVPAGVMALLYSAWGSPAGDAALGPRFMVSYLPFFASPLVVLWSGNWSSSRLPTGLLSLFALPSILLQVVFSSTSFLFHYHGKLLSVPEAERGAMVRSLYFDPDYSALSGMLKSFGAGLLDLRFVRWMPVENGLQVYPLFWLLLGFSLIAFAVAHRAGRYQPLQSRVSSAELTARPGSDRGRLALLPGIACLVLGLMGAGDRRENSLELVYSIRGERAHKTMARDISISDLSLDRVHNLMGGPNSTELVWRGYFEVPSEGKYELGIDSSAEAELEIDGRQVVARTGQRIIEIPLSAGWHKLKLKACPPPWAGHVRLIWRVPGGSWHPIGNLPLKRRV